MIARNLKPISRVFFLLSTLVTLQCGEIEIQRNKEADEKNRRNYLNRQLLCIIPVESTFQSRTDNYSHRNLNFFSAHLTQTVNTNFGLATSRDAARSWSFHPVPPPLRNSGIWDESIFYGIRDSEIYRTQDAGNTWSRFPLPISLNLTTDNRTIYAYTVFHVLTASHLVLFASPRDNQISILVSLNGGETWKVHSVPARELRHVFRKDNSIWFLVSEPEDLDSRKLYRITLGDSPIPLFHFLAGTNKNGVPSHLWFQNDTTGYASGGTSVFRTTDGGQNWTGISQNFPLDYTTVVYATDDTIYSFKNAERNTGFFIRGRVTHRGTRVRSEDFGTTWTSWNTAFSELIDMDPPNGILGASNGPTQFYSDFINRSRSLELPNFNFTKQASLWETHWLLCYFNAMSVPDTGRRERTPRNNDRNRDR